ncbi:DEAD/DEAH box helicase [Saccharolobus islandicus]|uniref:DEAD/DEAH box helicase n=1 Tax=Saccharolobus islandicus TaxID=43080 RepID=UPI0003781102|nr:DEAD/DEAH box helicase [Sulfolobus islandicus]
MINVTNEFLVRLKKLGYEDLTPIQKIAIPKILSGKNVLIIAPTGYGKTEAAILPIFYTIFKDKPEKISTLYITPLRALNRDLESRLKRVGDAFGISVNVRHGDSSQRERKEILDNPPDVLIVTPETLLYLILNDTFRKYFTNLKWIIIDELQEMLDEKRGIELSVLLQRIKKITRNRIQLIGISATIGDIEMAKMYLDREGEVEVASINAIKDIKVNLILPKIEKKDADLAVRLGLRPDTIARLEKLNEIIKNNKPIIIFTNTRETSEFIANHLTSNYSLKIGSHHGSLSREIRIKTENDFKSGNIDAIVATSSLELGIDIGRINLVVQYMSPRQVIRLIQRVGRSGHKIGRTSIGYVIPSEDVFDILECRAIIEALYSSYLEKPLFEENPLDVAAHEIAGMVLEGYKNPNEILEILRNSFYFKNFTDEMFESVIELLESAKIVKRREDGSLVPSRRIWKYYYTTNMIPDSIRSYIVIDHATNIKIGTLDEDFVASLDEESVFILGSKLWKVVSIENDRIFVERAELKNGILPSWFGESIPVEKEIARKVYEYIYMLEKGKIETEDDSISKVVREFVERGYPELRPDLILVEIVKNNLIIIHSPFGSRGNNTLGAIISVMLDVEKQTKTSYRADPYHIAISSVLPITENDMEKIVTTLNSLPIIKIVEILKRGIKESPQFKWKLLVEIKRFGMVDPEKEITLTSSIIKAYGDTIIGEEAVNELLVKNYDIEILKELKNYSWKIVEVYEASSLARQFLDKILNYTVFDKEEKPLMIEIFKKRLENKELRLICLSCGWNSIYSIINSPNKCTKCSSIFLTATNPDDNDSINIVRKAIKGEKLTSREKRQLEDLKRIASFFPDYGKYTLIALATNGVGPSNLGKVLSKLSEGENEFYMALIDEEKRFIRTRKYWH